MSIELMTAAWKIEKLSPMQKLVLVKLADNANDSGVCWPSITTISKQCCCSNRTVMRAIDDLQKMGYVTKESRENTSNVYTITPCQRVTPPCHSVTPPLSESHYPPCHSVTLTVSRTIKEPEDRSFGLDAPKDGAVNAEDENAESAEIFDLTAKPLEDTEAWPLRDCLETLKVSDFLEKFNEACPKKCRSITPQRRKKLATRMANSQFANHLDEIFAKMKASDFLNGKNNRGWTPTIDWLLENDTNFMKILEGKYDNATPPKATVTHPEATPKEPKGWKEFVTRKCKEEEYDPTRLEEYLTNGWGRLPLYIVQDFNNQTNKG